MRALIVGDIHSNLEAFQSVLADADLRGGFDTLWCLGDTVGYGPDPGACLELLRKYRILAVAGNHDHAAVGKIDVETFNYAAAAAARWTMGQLTDGEKLFLDELPVVATSERFTLVHGSLRAPVWEYLLDSESAVGTLALLSTQFCLVGHSHIPFICIENQDGPEFVEFTEDEVFELPAVDPPLERWIINPGGVGQPRDRDPRPSYAIYDSQRGPRGSIERHRVEYDIEATQIKMEDARLPKHLITRLEHGV